MLHLHPSPVGKKKKKWTAPRTTMVTCDIASLLPLPHYHTAPSHAFVRVDEIFVLVEECSTLTCPHDHSWLTDLSPWTTVDLPTSKDTIVWYSWFDVHFHFSPAVSHGNNMNRPRPHQNRAFVHVWRAAYGKFGGELSDLCFVPIILLIKSKVYLKMH